MKKSYFIKKYHYHYVLNLLKIKNLSSSLKIRPFHYNQKLLIIKNFYKIYISSVVQFNKFFVFKYK